VIITIPPGSYAATGPITIICKARFMWLRYHLNQAVLREKRMSKLRAQAIMATVAAIGAK